MLRPYPSHFPFAPIVLAVTILMTSAVQAQTAEAQAGAPIAISIASQPLSQALNELARQARLELIAPPGLLTGKTAPAVSGSLTVRQALDRLLADSGLSADVEGTNVFVKGTPAGSASGPTLAAVTVSARAERSTITEGSGSYTPSAASTSTRLELSLRETPQSVSVITRQRMDDQGLVQLADVVAQTPGLIINQSGNQGSDSSPIYSRGFTVQNYLVDGVNQSLSTYTDLLQSNDMALYDRVEVVRGANGLMTGKGAPGASINLIRKRPTEQFQASARVEAGSWNYYRAQADISTPLNEAGTVRGRLVAAWQDNDSYIDRLNERKKALYGIIEADLSPTTRAALGITLQEQDASAHARGGRPAYYADGSRAIWARSDSAAADWGSSQRRSNAVFAELEQQLGAGWRIKGTLSRMQTDYDEVLGYASGGNPNAATGAGVNLWASRWKGNPTNDTFDVYATGPFTLLGRKHELVAGATFARGTVDAPSFGGWQSPAVSNIFTWNGNTPQSPNFVDAGRYTDEERSNSAYTTARFKPTDALAVLLGARITDWKRDQTSLSFSTGQVVPTNRAENNKLTPYVGLVYDIDRNWSAYASYTSIFMPQSYKDAQGNYIDPLLGNSYEAGIKGEFLDKQLNVAGAIYNVKQDNLAISLPGVFAPDGSQAYRSVSGTSTRGFEVEMSGALAPNWQASASFGRSITQDRDGKPLNTNIPQNNFKLFTSYRIADWGNGTTIGGGVRWQSAIYSDSQGPAQVRFTQPSYAVADLMLRYPISAKTTLTANLYNVLDKTYYTTTGNSYYGAPRNLRVAVDVTF